MKDVQCYELFRGIAPKNHAFSFQKRSVKKLSMWKKENCENKAVCGKREK